jgi:putative nucleotidyltransferase with HDIG domain
VLVLLPLLLLNLVLIRRQRYASASLVLFALASGALTWNMALFNSIYDVAMIAFPALVTFGSILFGRRSVPYITVVVIALVSGIYLAGDTGFSQIYTGDLTVQLQDYITNVIFLVLTGFLVNTIMGILQNNVVRIIATEQRLHAAYEETLEGWARALELRDQETIGHSRRVTEMTLRLAARMSVPEDRMRDVRWGALLHDIGKMGISDHILLKPGGLTEPEFDEIKKHPEIALDLLRDIPYLEGALTIPRCHHEYWDGSGYPAGLAGEAIPLEARIFTVVDVYDAIVSLRPYAQPQPHAEALAWLHEHAGEYYDPEVVAEFEAMVNEAGLIERVY